MDLRNRDDRSKNGAESKSGVSSRRSSVVTAVLLFIAAGLVLDAVAGQRGWFENRRGQQQLEQSQMELEALQRRNGDLRDLARRLREQDPATIEEFARDGLGYIRPGEKLFTVHDAPQQKK